MVESIYEMYKQVAILDRDNLDAVKMSVIIQDIVKEAGQTYISTHNSASSGITYLCTKWDIEAP